MGAGQRAPGALPWKGGPRRGSAGIVRIKITAAGERSFLPVPAEIPVCGHNPTTTWSETLTSRLTVQNVPPHRLILLDGEVVFRYRLDNQMEERFFLLRLIANSWITARALARRWGVSRNTIATVTLMGDGSRQLYVPERLRPTFDAILAGARVDQSRYITPPLRAPG